MPRPKSFSDPAEFVAKPSQTRKGKQSTTETKYYQYTNQPIFWEANQRLIKGAGTSLSAEAAEKAKMNY